MKPVFASTAHVLFCCISTAAEPETSTPSAQCYTPGLDEFMSAIEVRHAKLWFTGKGKNGQLAAYELDEFNEAFKNAAQYQSEIKGKPIARIIQPTTVHSTAQLEKAIETKDFARFSTGYDSLSHDCSVCHQATNHGFISIQRPTLPPLTDQRFSLDRQP